MFNVSLMSTLQSVINKVGSKAELARRLGCSQQVIHNWMRRGRIPAERCIDIERATGGVVTCEELRPDLADRWAYLRGTRKEAA